jgi:nicotinate-nucleotide pyrophosphorylase (carboxylating)
MSTMASDLRDTIFASLGDRQFTARVSLTEAGLVCGVELAASKAAALGCRVLDALADGDAVQVGQSVLSYIGTAKAIAMAEDCVPGAIGKSSAIARAVRLAQQLAGPRVRVVSGAAKKMPEEIKAQVRRAVHRGGGSGRIADGPFVYLDKNYVLMFGSVARTLAAVAGMTGYVRVIQLRGLVESLQAEAEAAIAAGAEILMVDTGRLEDLDLVARLARASGRREQATIAFAGDIAMADIAEIARHDVDILDIGRAVLDAPMVDVKIDVVATETADGC